MHLTRVASTDIVLGTSLPRQPHALRLTADVPNIDTPGFLRDAQALYEGVVPNRKAVARGFGQRPVIAWLTGLSGSGKTTLAHAVADSLRSNSRQAVILDGDDLRAGLNRDLGFTAADRDESVRRAAETALLLADAGLVVIVALISPYRRGRAAARQIAGRIPFLEVFVDTPHVICERRDVKGLYARARSGDLPNFTNVSDPYETPEVPDMTLKTQGWTPKQSAVRLVAKLLAFSAI